MEKIENSPGVFAVICEESGTYYLLDVDHSEDVKQAILDHERRECWERYHRGTLQYAVLYERNFPEGDGEDIEKEIRRKYRSIPCP